MTEVFIVISRKWGTVEVVGGYDTLEQAAYAAVAEEVATTRVCSINRIRLNQRDILAEETLKMLCNEEDIAEKVAMQKEYVD